MKKIIDNLKSTEIVYKKAVELLRDYISEKYKSQSETYRISVFADAIHKIINEHINEFSNKEQSIIKENLLSEMAVGKISEINAYDIMKTCIRLDMDDNQFVEHTKKWINNEQDIAVDTDMFNQVVKFVQKEIQRDNQEILEEKPSDKEWVAMAPEQALLNELERTYENYNPIKAKVENYVKTEEIKAEEELVEKIEEIKEEELIGELAILEDRPIRQVSRDRQMDILLELEMSVNKEENAIEEVSVSIWDVIENLLAKSNWRLIGLLGGVLILVGIGLYIGTRGASSGIAEGIEVGKTPSAVTKIKDIELLENKSNIVTTIINGKVIDPSHLHNNLRYKDVDEEKLKVWLDKKDSLLGEEENFRIILDVAKIYGVNPLLLFAITGQEQNFVPKEHEFAMEIINNPFNVYGSWKKYNTDLDEATRIASRTILTGSEGRPDKEDPVKWINIEGGYAEDTNWHKGVSLILEELETVAGIGK